MTLLKRCTSHDILSSSDSAAHYHIAYCNVSKIIFVDRLLFWALVENGQGPMSLAL